MRGWVLVCKELQLLNIPKKNVLHNSRHGAIPPLPRALRARLLSEFRSAHFARPAGPGDAPPPAIRHYQLVLQRAEIGQGVDKWEAYEGSCPSLFAPATLFLSEVLVCSSLSQAPAQTETEATSFSCRHPPHTSEQQNGAIRGVVLRRCSTPRRLPFCSGWWLLQHRGFGEPVRLHITDKPLHLRAFEAGWGLVASDAILSIVGSAFTTTSAAKASA